MCKSVLIGDVVVMLVLFLLSLAALIELTTTDATFYLSNTTLTTRDVALIHMYVCTIGCLIHPPSYTLSLRRRVDYYHPHQTHAISMAGFFTDF